MQAQATTSLTVTHELDAATALWRVPVPEQMAWLVAGEPITTLVQSSGMLLHESAHDGALVLTDGQGRLLYHAGTAPAEAAAAAQSTTDAVRGLVSSGLAARIMPSPMPLCRGRNGVFSCANPGMG